MSAANIEEGRSILKNKGLHKKGELVPRFTTRLNSSQRFSRYAKVKSTGDKVDKLSEHVTPYLCVRFYADNH